MVSRHSLPIALIDPLAAHQGDGQSKVEEARKSGPVRLWTRQRAILSIALNRSQRVSTIGARHAWEAVGGEFHPEPSAEASDPQHPSPIRWGPTP